MMIDPVFGKTKASIFTEFRLPQNNFTLGENPVLDSIRLSFGYTGRLYGDITTFQNIRVYEISENIPELDTLYTNMFVEYYPQPIGQLSLRPDPREPVDTLDTPAHFIIPLSNEFGQKIIDANDTEYFENIPNFLEYFKGLYITVEDDFQEGGSIFNINMGSTFTSLQLYYRLEDDTVSRLQNFRITEFARRINYIERFGYQDAHPLLQQQLEGQIEAGEELVFLQSFGRT
jgi:hypothetical protein